MVKFVNEHPFCFGIQFAYTGKFLPDEKQIDIT